MSSAEASFGRTALITSLATLFARGLGFARNSALAIAIGTSTVGDAYNVTNNIPNMLFFLLGGGTIAAVFVPLLVRHGKGSEARFNEFASILIIAGSLGGLITSALLVALRAPLLTVLGGGAWSDTQKTLAKSLSLWCLPQVFFFVVVMIFTQILNAKGRFWAASWTPALNNLLIIANCSIIAYIGGVSASDPSSLSRTQIILLGTGTLGGSILQAGALAWGCRLAGLRLRIPKTLRGYAFREAASVGSMTVVVAAMSQICNIGIATLCTRAGAIASAHGHEGRGYSTFFYAQAIILAVQLVLTGGSAMILLQRLSAMYAEGDNSRASATIGDIILRSSALLIPASGLMIATAPRTIDLLFAHGQTHGHESAVITLTYVLMAVGLLPYGLQPILVRPFYASGDARTPLTGYAVVYGTYLGATTIGYFVAPPQAVVIIAASAFSISYWLDLPMKVRRLHTAGLITVSRKLRNSVCRCLAATVLAGLIAAAAAEGVFRELSSLNVRHIYGDLVGEALGAVLFVVAYEATTRGSDVSVRSLVRWLR